MREILAGLPADFPAPIVVAQHRGESSVELLVKLLAARTKLRVKSAAPLERLRPGCVFVCPPASHMEVASEHLLRTWKGPHIHYVRPSCDLLFQSVAAVFGTRGVCVVLSGSGSDGAWATRHVRHAGGVVIAQDGHSADHPGMPDAAVDFGRVDLVLPVKEIAFALSRLVEMPPADSALPSRTLKSRFPKPRASNLN